MFASGSFGPPATLHVRLVHKTTAFDVYLDAQASFAELRNKAKVVTGLPMEGFKLLFRGREKSDRDALLLSGLKNGSIVHVVETEAYMKQRAAGLAALQRAHHGQATAAPASVNGWQAFKDTPPPPVPSAATAAAGGLTPHNIAGAQWRPEFPPSTRAAAASPQPQHSRPQQPDQRQSPQPKPQPGVFAANPAPRRAPGTASPQPQQQVPAAQHAQQPHQHQHPQQQQQPAYDPQFPPQQRGTAATQSQQQPSPAQQGRGPIGPQLPPELQAQRQAEEQREQQQHSADPAEALKQQLLAKVDAVQCDMDANLATQVDDLLAGPPVTKDSPAHQESILLLELLTRVMLALDGVRAPDGGETPAEVRAARKAAVVRAQKLIERVEAARSAGFA